MTTTPSAAPPQPDVQRPLRLMRRYTTSTLVGAVVIFGGMIALSAWTVDTRPLAVAAVAVTALLAWHAVRWERGAPWPLAAASVASSFVFSCACYAVGATAFSSLLASMSIVLVLSSPPPRSAAWFVAGGGVVLGPPVAALVATGEPTRFPDLMVASILYVLAISMIRFTVWSWGLMLQLDRARETAGELAVMQERYRFAADLHDIQGQALHVSRLQLQLAAKLIDRDPAAARERIVEAESMLAATIAETRTLAYGERRVALAGELANSAELIRAAGIALRVEGEPPADHPHDALLGLAVREATTNLLRHAQPTHVEIRLSRDAVEIVNDGVHDAVRAPRGLARLGERFAAAGGALVSHADGGRFVVEARA